MRKSSSSSEAIDTKLFSNIRNLLPMRSISSSKKLFPNPKLNRKISSFSLDSENTPPPDPNTQLCADPVPLCPPKPTPKEDVSESSLEGSDLPVKVVVRIRPANEHEREGLGGVTKVSSDSLSVEDRRFSFDSVLDLNSNQEDVFKCVGIPLARSALAGYNASILSYGQTGSGKTYTLWGPPSAMVEDPSPGSQQGIAPRMFQMLFSEIERMQENSEQKQINYQCRCSFLEVYNDQIGDLLDPTQRNLEIKDDPKTGLHVENLTEEYVSTYEDVSQVLIKGLSSRKVGSTSINSKSSRSHVIFTFIIESWCKGSSSTCFSSSRISRITLVDLAGLDRNKVEDMGKEIAKEGKYVRKSLSHLGLLVNFLAKGTQLGSFEDVPYEGSNLTQLLRESLGGNAKLAVICNISPGIGNNAETVRTLRFGQRVKSIQNKPVINEISEDDVNDLSDQIRQLKEELIRARSDVRSSGRKSGCVGRKSARESLNMLRASLNRSLMLPRIDSDSENEVNIDEKDVKELHQQLDKLKVSSEDVRDVSENIDSTHFSSVEENFETDLMSEDEVNGPDGMQNEGVGLERHEECVFPGSDPAPKSGISVSLSPQSAVLPEPTLSESPKIGNSRKSMAMSTAFSASTNLNSNELRESIRQSENVKKSLRSSKLLTGSTQSLAASLHRGLEIIGNHQQNSTLDRSSVSFSFEHLALKPCPEVDGTKSSSLTNGTSSILCASCQQKIINNPNENKDSSNTLMITEDEAEQHQAKNTGVDNDSGEANERQKELESICKEQAATIEKLNKLVEQYKNEREASLLGEPQMENSLPAENNPSNVTLLLEECRNEYVQTPNGQNNKLSQVTDDVIQPEIVKEKCEVKEIQEVLDNGKPDTSFSLNEKEALLQEIQSLRTKLRLYTDVSANKSSEKLRSSLLAQSIQLQKSMDLRPSTLEEFEAERERWTEMESEWISLTDDLRVDLECSRQQTENVEMELRSAKKCNEELDDALSRAIVGHARMVEHYADLQEKFDELVGKHRALMEGVAEIKRAAAKAGTKAGNRFAKAVAAELCSTRMQREREREFLRKENKSLKIQLRDTAEAVHAAGELLVRLRESEQTVYVAEENIGKLQEENDKLKKQIEKLKRKHKMEMVTMKQYMAESKLPESALQPLYREDSDIPQSTMPYDDQAWRAEFGAIYQEHY